MSHIEEKHLCNCHKHDEHEHHHCKQCSCGHSHNHEDHEHIHENTKTLTDNNMLSFRITGLDCPSCAAKVEKAIKKMPEIENANLIFSTEILQIVPHKNINKEELKNSIQNEIDRIEKGVLIEFNTSVKKNKKYKLDKNSVLNLSFGIALYIISILTKDIAPETLWFRFLITYLWIGYPVLIKAFKNIKRGQIFDENFLMCVATIGAFAIKDYSEAVAVMLFYGIGELFQSYAVNKTRSSITSLMDIKSEYANKKTPGGIKQVNPDEVNLGDTLIVKVGEKIPVDGIVTKGQSSLNTSSLTGESLPFNIQEEDTVLSGSINLTDIIEIKTTKRYEDSTASKIIDMIENSSAKKAPIEGFITKFAKVYTPIVCIIALLVAVVPVLIIKDAIFTDWLYKALTFLVISCPCALVISVPLGLYAGVGKASEIGALIKGGNYLELLKDIDVVVFDKTGTLTTGKLEVTQINGPEELLKYAAYAEHFSNHPIAKCIVNKYSNDIDENLIKDYKEISGKGTSLSLNNESIIVGNLSFIKEYNIEVEELDAVGTYVYVAVNNKYLGSIVVADKIKDTSKESIQLLKNNKIKTVMLTGDNSKVSNDVSDKLGIDEVHSELLPSQKVEEIEKFISPEHKVAFVGDGINDAPVLIRSDIGVAMGGVGSDVAIEAADIVLINDDIKTLAKTIELSKKVNKILKENITFILVVKILFLIFTIAGMANMWMGVFADVGVTLIAVLNVLRILRKR